MTKIRTQAHSRGQDGSLEVTNVTLKIAILACLIAGLCSASLPQAAANPAGPTEALYLKLQSAGLDKTRVYRIRGGALDRAALRISLDDGTIAFSVDVGGRITGAFFRGEGEVLLAPPNSIERSSLAFFTGAAILEEKFSSAYFRFNDDVYAELKSSLRAPVETEAFTLQWNTTAQNLAQEDALRLLVSFVNAQGTEGADRFLHAYLQGDRLGTFDVRYDSLAPEQISAGEHRTVEGEDFYDVWASFSTDADKHKAALNTDSSPTNGFDVSQFRLQAQIRPPTELQAKAVLTIVPRREGKRMLLFELSRLLQVRQVSANGQPIEFIHNPAIEGSQLSRRGNDVVAVILPAAMRVGSKIELSFDYSGAVLSEAANGLLYVGEHGTWYPNIGFIKASYDLEFRYPLGWTLVATGRRTDTKTAGAEQSSRWITERPIPVAGFNLGKYSQATTRAGTATVVTYATSNVERTFAQAIEPHSSAPGLEGPSRPLLNSETDIPSPARNAQMVGNTAARAVAFYQQRFGPLPYSELALTQFPGKISQGWPGLVFLASYAFLTASEREHYQPDPKLRLLLEQTTSHEVAHQWWGDLVTWSGYRDQWVMEALANYSALMLLESRNPGAFRELMQKFRDDLLTKNRKGEAITTAGPVTLGLRLSSSQFPDGYEVISYGRGTWLIHMIRCMLRDGERGKAGHSKSDSDDAFLRALRKLRTEYENKPVTSADLLNIFASELPSTLWYEKGKSLSWFYDGWVNGSSIPAFGLRDVKFAEKGGASTVSGTIVQEHAPENLVTAVPVYAVIAGKNTFLARVFAEGPETQFHLSVPPRTHKLVIDPEQTLLARNK
jgi:Peptidase family M1 domain